MAIDRAGARRRVRIITGWAAGGAAVMTAAFAFGASRGSHVAKATTRSSSGSPDGAENTLPQTPDPRPVEPQGAYQQAPQPSQGFTPPASSTAPPAAMSGGS
jgi:hypothetical protein